ncbi:TetR/AcrR family transcriptional regulator [Phenylobacterium aquaticum]|uniref:TetR/AcrR family transcriptional regulator n=1 Tax=Phenylobacterium aquaticum TaxID=1763816 RepID=UPI0026EE8760|nr:TetR/AcrR family transcriptional regulator [Phenylobacterium aquaticum]
MLPAGQPKFRRRKADRPEEIVRAALTVFASKGFAAARLEEIAAEAGVSKGALYLYFATKEDMFRAVVAQGLAPNLAFIQAAAASAPAFADLARTLAALLPQVAERAPIAAIAKMVIGEARNFPELARVWHDQLVGPVIATFAHAIAAAQARGEVRPGDPRAYAVSLASGLLLGLVFNETFAPVGAAPFDIPALARQHVETVLAGMLTNPGARP